LDPCAFSRWAFLVLPAALPGFGAEDLGAIKQRLAQTHAGDRCVEGTRVVGENNRGFLEARGALSAEKPPKVMSAQNTDRSAAYGALAQQTGSSPDQGGSGACEEDRGEEQGGRLAAGRRRTLVP